MDKMRFINCAIFLLCSLLLPFGQANSAEKSEGDRAGDNINNNAAVLPVVLWHGMGDTCCLPFSLGSIRKLIEEHTNGTYVRSLKIGSNAVLDYESGFFIHPNKQIDYVCEQLAKDEQLTDGYNAIGFSQGGQFL